jgi:protein PsiE
MVVTLSSEHDEPEQRTARRLGTATSDFHRDMKDAADSIGSFLVDAFHLLGLFAIGATTVWSAAAVFIGIAAQGHASLGDILLLFIYLEFGAMVGIYFKTTRLPVRYLMYIAMTALGRVLIEIVGAEHRTGMVILIIAGAILLLSFAVLVLRYGESSENEVMSVAVARWRCAMAAANKPNRRFGIQRAAVAIYFLWLCACPLSGLLSMWLQPALVAQYSHARQVSVE